MISAQILAKDEEELVGPLLEHLNPWCDEIVVVDTGSTDRTREIATSYGARVYPFMLIGGFAAARNHGLQQTKCDWAFQVDCDEWPTIQLLKWLQDNLPLAGKCGISGIAVRRHNLVDRKEIGWRTWEWHVRVFEPKFNYVGRIHESVMIPSPHLVASAPEDCVLEHYKTTERQEQQNAFYSRWT